MLYVLQPAMGLFIWGQLYFPLRKARSGVGYRAPQATTLKNKNMVLLGRRMGLYKAYESKLVPFPNLAWHRIVTQVQDALRQFLTPPDATFWQHASEDAVDSLLAAVDTLCKLAVSG